VILEMETRRPERLGFPRDPSGTIRYRYPNTTECLYCSSCDLYFGWDLVTELAPPFPRIP
jgi:hypothetical protein